MPSIAQTIQGIPQSLQEILTSSWHEDAAIGAKSDDFLLFPSFFVTPRENRARWQSSRNRAGWPFVVSCCFFFQFVYATLSCLGCPASRGQSLQSPFIWEVNWHLGNGRTWKNRPSFEGHPWSIGDRSLFTFFRNSFDSSPTWPRFPFFLKMKKTKQLFSPSDSSSTPGNVLLTADSEMGRWPRVTVESLIFPFLFTLFCTSPVTPSLCPVAWRARFYRFKKGPRRNLSLMTLYRTLTVLQSIPFDASLRDVILFLRYRVKAWHFLGKNSALQSLSRFAGFHFFQLFYG